MAKQLKLNDERILANGKVVRPEKSVFEVTIKKIVEPKGTDPEGTMERVVIAEDGIGREITLRMDLLGARIFERDHETGNVVAREPLNRALGKNDCIRVTVVKQLEGIPGLNLLPHRVPHKVDNSKTVYMRPTSWR